MEAERLIRLIESAFPVTPLPEMSLHQAKLTDASMSRELTELAWQQAGTLDAGRTWRDYSDETLIACDVALAHLDERSFVYYLPAFLLYAIRHCPASWPDPAEPLVGAVVFSVTHRTPYSLGRFRMLSAEQRAAVVAFLEYVAANGNDHERPQAAKALARYWKTDEGDKPHILAP